MIIELHLSISDPDLSVLHTLKKECELSSAQIKPAIGKGCLWLESGSKVRRLRRIKTSLKTGEQLHFYYNQQILEQQPLTALLIEDNHAYSVWYKPAGMLCQGSKWGDHTTINRYVEKQFQRTSFIVHRLDKMTSGLIIIAHQKKIAAAFTRIFEQRKITKEYRALVHGLFEDAELTIDTPVNGKAAVSHVQLITSSAEKQQSILDISIDTGRKHQIREHLSSIDFPIVGDRLYGIEDASQEYIPNLKLVSYKLSFICPVTLIEKSYQLENEMLPIFLVN